MPTDLRTHQDILEYRRVGAGRTPTAAEIAARDRGIRVDARLLICPMLDRAECASTRQFADSPGWRETSHGTAWSHVLGGAQPQPPGENLKLGTLPPIVLDTGCGELCSDSILDYKTRLSAAGTPVEMRMYSGAFHSSDCLLEGAEVSRDAHRARASWLRRVIAGNIRHGQGGWWVITCQIIYRWVAAKELSGEHLSKGPQPRGISLLRLLSGSPQDAADHRVVPSLRRDLKHSGA